MESKFIGRENELKDLKNLFKNKKASLVVCRGRRRIGKSRLIQEFGKQADTFIEIQGLPPRENISVSDQLNAFSEQFSTQAGFPKLKFENWNQAFSILEKAIDDNKQTVVFLDEISWLAQGDKDFAGRLKISWDTELKKHPKLILVLCGSVSSWLEKNILNNTGFVGRISYDLKLEELSLSSCNAFWGNNNKLISITEKLKILCVTGGIPRYLEEIRPELSAEENIHRLCFKREGLLFFEFEHIFSTTFGRRAEIYKKILQALTFSSYDLDQISSNIKTEKSGTLSTYLNDLEQAGFVAKDISYNIQTGQYSRFAKYRLKDNYSRFYLRYIEKNKDRINTSINFNSNIETFIDWDTLKGFQFENLVLNNLSSLIKLLDIKPETILYASPYYQKKNKQHEACQVDLLIITKYSFYVCEMKFRGKTDVSVIDEVQRKISKLKITTNTSVRPILIYNGELDKAVSDEDYFFGIVNIANLFKQHIS
ncbi:MAG: ATP-binding protein [Prolixibacteraceae bacterium]|nr:ATP-binding protein [Prolixibacteraceae bacterium]